MLVKDYLGKNAEQEIWKLDAALVSQINATLKQAAIEEGQWNAKRKIAGGVDIEVARVELRREARRISDAKKAALAAGQPWPPSHRADPVPVSPDCPPTEIPDSA